MNEEKEPEILDLFCELNSDNRGWWVQTRFSKSEICEDNEVYDTLLMRVTDGVNLFEIPHFKLNPNAVGIKDLTMNTYIEILRPNLDDSSFGEGVHVELKLLSFDTQLKFLMAYRTESGPGIGFVILKLVLDKYETDTQGISPRLFSMFRDMNKAIKENKDDRTKKDEIIRIKNAAQTTLNEMEHRMKNEEAILYGKFSVVLNTKKRKITELKDDIKKLKNKLSKRTRRYKHYKLLFMGERERRKRGADSDTDEDSPDDSSDTEDEEEEEEGEDDDVLESQSQSQSQLISQVNFDEDDDEDEPQDIDMADKKTKNMFIGSNESQDDFFSPPLEVEEDDEDIDDDGDVQMVDKKKEKSQDDEDMDILNDMEY